MEDEFYTVYGYTAHKSCIFDGRYFSNAKYVCQYNDFAALEKRCNLVDNITENINLPISFMYCKRNHINCNFVYIDSYNNMRVYLPLVIEFASYEELYDYISQNYPHLIKSHDIKIALKD